MYMCLMFPSPKRSTIVLIYKYRNYKFEKCQFSRGSWVPDSIVQIYQLGPMSDIGGKPNCSFLFEKYQKKLKIRSRQLQILKNLSNIMVWIWDIGFKCRLRIFSDWKIHKIHKNTDINLINLIINLNLNGIK